MSGLFDVLLDPSGLTPHGFCLAWQPGLIWLQAASDLIIALAYYSIPLALVVFARRRADLVFPWMFWLFAAFILACGTTHVLGVLTLWVPAYWTDGIVKATTACLSLITAIALWPLIPQALALPSPAALRRVNVELEQQISARDAAVRRLAESEARSLALFVQAPVPMHAIDAEKRILGVNDLWLDLLGYRRDEVIGRLITDLQEPESAARANSEWEAGIRKGVLRDAERRFVCESGDILDVLVSATYEHGPNGQMQRGICALTDITARKRTEAALRESEARLRQAEKMTALGQLAGGIAHDFNNVLQAILGALTLIEKRPDDQGGVRRLARMSQEAADRGATVTRRLLAFARRGELRAERLDVAAVLTGVYEILLHTIGDGIMVSLDLATGLQPVLADRGQLETVVVNLATNARDAMAHGGRLTLSADIETVRAETPPHSAGLMPGDYVRLMIADTGSGMDAATLARAGEPFFTTKPLGSGTGLGLPMARGFAEQSGGSLSIASDLGKGTTVTMWLPVTTDDAASGVVSQQRSQQAPLPSFAEGPAGARVLVVDDEGLVRDVIAANLKQSGYSVLVAASGVEAIELLDSGVALDAVVTDLAMPGVNGLAVIRAAREARPDLPAILLTGYAGDLTAMGVGTAFDGDITLLRKPIHDFQLLDKLRILLSTSGSAR